MTLSKEPAVLFGLIAAVVAAITDAIQKSSEGGSVDGWTLVKVLVPLLAAIATRYNVVPVETVRDALTRTRSANAAVNDLAEKVDVAVADRPASS